MCPADRNWSCFSRPIPTALVVVCCLSSVPGHAHVFVARAFRAGAYPPYDGSGWFAEAFLDVPNFDLRHHAALQGCLGGPDQPFFAGCRLGDLDRDGDVDLRDIAAFQKTVHDPHLLRAERLLGDDEPDFTFRTDWIDFPSGPQDSRLDRDFATVGDFLDDYIYDVSDTSKLDEPFGSLLLRFSGFLKVTIDDEVRIRDVIGLPIWIEIGTMGYDGYRARVGVTIYRFPNINWAQPFYNWGPAVEGMGLFPVEITYYNVYDPNGVMGNERAGIEIYSWHGDGLPWPAGSLMAHETRGAGTLLPPRVIYREHDALPLVKGDFNADAHIDLRDVRWYQSCADPDYFFLPTGCDSFDFDSNGAISDGDFVAFQAALKGPGVLTSAESGP